MTPGCRAVTADAMLYLDRSAVVNVVGVEHELNSDSGQIGIGRQSQIGLYNRP
jgi:hypothetical protein